MKGIYMNTTSNWNPYTKTDGNLCSYYYNKARQQYGENNNKISIYDSTIKSYNVGEPNDFDFSDEYMSSVNRLSELSIPYLNNAGFNQYTKFAVPHEDKYRNKLIEDELENLLGMILPMVEKDFYQSNVAVSYTQMYKSIIRDEPDPNNRSTWQWHVDCYPEESNKLMIYLTDVTENDAPFTYLVDENDNPVLLESPAKHIDPKKELRGNFEELNPDVPDDRIPFEWVQEKIKKGYEEKTWTGKKGSFAIFRPNVAHKATIPKGNERTVVSFTLRPSMTKRNSYWYDSPAMKNINHHDWYGGEDINQDKW